MRVVGRLAAVLLLGLTAGGCGGRVLDGRTRPAVIPKLSELPDDPDKRAAILAQAQETEPAEHRAPLTRSERRTVTAAAYLAAIVGQVFSTTENTTLGLATSLDEPARPGHGGHAPEGLGPDAAIADPAPAGPLLPWIVLPATPAPAALAAPAAPAPAQARRTCGAERALRL